MAINIIDPQQPGRQHVDSYWAATAGPEVENTAPVTADMDVDVAIIGGCHEGAAHYALGYIGTGVALSTYRSRLLAPQVVASTKLRASTLFPLPALRRVYQRAMYQVYEVQDRLP
jgi:hypothetical protein